MLTIDVIFRKDSNKLWRSHGISVPVVRNVASQALRYFSSFQNGKFGNENLSLCVILTNDDEMHDLNLHHFEKDYPTDVLSFPGHDFQYCEESVGDSVSYSHILRKNYKYDLEDDLSLGDIVVSYDAVLRDSDKYGIGFIEHFTHLVVHSVLHLIGFSHEDDEKEAIIMRSLENDILKSKFCITLSHEWL